MYIKIKNMPKKKQNKKEIELETWNDEELENFEESYDDIEDNIEEEGQLSVDVYQDKKNIIVKSTVAGVEPEDVDVSFDNDMLTIRGKRKKDLTIDEDNYFYQECYWGSFSRSIILPVDVDSTKINAAIKNGILTITLPKVKKKDISIKIKDEN